MSFAIVGDIALNGLISTQPDKNNDRYNWLGDELNKYSGVFANLETPIFATENNPDKNYYLYTYPDVARTLLKKFNIVCVSLANNHILDCGVRGLANTISLLDDCGIRHTGAGLAEEHIKPVIVTLSDRSIGFIAYVDSSTNPKVDSYTKVLFNAFEVDNAINEISKLRPEVDTLIVSIHWGEDYSLYPDESQIKVARRLIEAGADIIMGHHSHMLQPFEAYNSGLIFYGIGNLTFGDFLRNGRKYAMYRKTKTSAIFIFDTCNGLRDIISTRELKGNVIVPGGIDIQKYNKKLWCLFRVRECCVAFRYLFIFHEKVLSRVYEYFFGYYMNPLVRLFQFRNLTKLGKLFKGL